MNGGPSGFNNAAVTRAFIVTSGIFTVLSGIQGRSNRLGLSYQLADSYNYSVCLGLIVVYLGHAAIALITAQELFGLQSEIFQKFHLGNSVASIFAFSSTPELMFGLYLLYYFRVFERQIGSNKYSVFISFSLLASILLEVFALALLKDPSLKLTSGPYGLIFASFVPFFFDIPVSTRFRVFGIRFSDKSFIYLAGLQLLLSSWKRSVIPGICGLLAGLFYRLNLFYIRKAKFPAFISSFFSKLSWPSAGSTSTPAPARSVPRSMPAYAGRQVERTHPSPAPSSAEPPEASIETLVSMGFDRNSARQALVQARNDINAATNILLEAQSH